MKRIWDSIAEGFELSGPVIGMLLGISAIILVVKGLEWLNM